MIVKWISLGFGLLWQKKSVTLNISAWVEEIMVVFFYTPNQIRLIVVENNRQTRSRSKCTKYELLFVSLEQTWTLVPGTSRPRSALCGPTSNASTVAATTRATATRTSCLWTTACKAFWDSGWTYPRTSKWTTTSGWSGRSSPNLFHGKNCYSENQ